MNEIDLLVVGGLVGLLKPAGSGVGSGSFVGGEGLLMNRVLISESLRMADGLTDSQGTDLASE
jgi:hypothetical protein